MSKWEEFANQDAEYFILTTDGVDYSTEEGQKYFFESGVNFVHSALGQVEDLLKEKGRALEIGCGIGRLTFPHAEQFKMVSVVDISPTMLNKLKRIAKERGVDNINTYLPHEGWDELTYDYAYSFIVFQHIADFNIIKGYIERISKSLKKGGIAQLHFDTRDESALYTLRNNLPNFLLPKTQKKGIRRIRRSPEKLKESFTRNGLIVAKEINTNSELHTFILKKV